MCVLDRCEKRLIYSQRRGACMHAAAPHHQTKRGTRSASVFQPEVGHACRKPPCYCGITEGFKSPTVRGTDASETRLFTVRVCQIHCNRNNPLQYYYVYKTLLKRLFNIYVFKLIISIKTINKTIILQAI